MPLQTRKTNIDHAHTSQEDRVIEEFATTIMEDGVQVDNFSGSGEPPQDESQRAPHADIDPKAIIIEDSADVELKPFQMIVQTISETLIPSRPELTINGRTLTPLFRRRSVARSRSGGLGNEVDAVEIEVFIPPLFSFSASSQNISLRIDGRRYNARISDETIALWVKELAARARGYGGSRLEDLSPPPVVDLAARDHLRCMIEHPLAFQKFDIPSHLASFMGLTLPSSPVLNNSVRTIPIQPVMTTETLLNEFMEGSGRLPTWTELAEISYLSGLAITEFEGPYLLRLDPAEARLVSHKLIGVSGIGSWNLLVSAYISTLKGDLADASRLLYKFEAGSSWVSIGFLVNILAVLTMRLNESTQLQKWHFDESVMYGLMHVVRGMHNSPRLQDRRLVVALVAFLPLTKMLSPWVREDWRDVLCKSFAFSKAFRDVVSGEPNLSQRIFPPDIEALYLRVQAVLETDAPVELDALHACISSCLALADAGYVRAREISDLLFARLMTRSVGPEDMDSVVSAVRQVAVKRSWAFVSKYIYDPDVDLTIKQTLSSTFSVELSEVVGKEVHGDHWESFKKIKNTTRSYHALLDCLVRDEIPQAQNLEDFTSSFAAGARHDVLARFHCSIGAEILALTVRHNKAWLIDLANSVLSVLALAIPAGAVYGQARNDLTAMLKHIESLAFKEANYPVRLGAAAKFVLQKSFGDTSIGSVLAANQAEQLVDSIASPRRRVLIAIYSCELYLDSRALPALQSWGEHLIDLGFDVLVFTGDCAKQFDRHVPLKGIGDTYEELPAKSLGLIEWFKHSKYDWMFKVDDDCIVSPVAFEELGLYHVGDYVGRLLHKTEKIFDRQWHQEKSRSPLARAASDLSPTPSTWADGGAGYFLSKYAANMLLQAAGEQKGDFLIQTSYMEDKLVGDLLASVGITPIDVGYKTHQFRRNTSKFPAVSQYSNYPFSDGFSNVSLIHTDCDTRLEATFDSFGPQPARITLASNAVQFGGGGNQMELVKRALHQDDQGPLVIACLRNERHIVGHYLDFYRERGIRHFVLVDNLSDDGTLEYLYAQPDVTLYSTESEYSGSRFGVDWQQALLERHAMGRWVLVVDADEFIELPPDMESFSDLVAQADQYGDDAFCCLMLDVYPKVALSEFDIMAPNALGDACYTDSVPLKRWHMSNGVFSNGPDVKSAVRHRITWPVHPNLYTAMKYCLFKFGVGVALTQGLHDVGGIKPSARRLGMRHVKFHNQFMKKVTEEVSRKQHFDSAKEYLTYLERIAIHGDQLYGQDSVEIRTSFAIYNLISKFDEMF